MHAAACKAARAGLKASVDSNQEPRTGAGLDDGSVSVCRGTAAISVNAFRRHSSDMATNNSQLPRRAADITCSSVMPLRRLSGNGALQTVIRCPCALPTHAAAPALALWGLSANLAMISEPSIMLWCAPTNPVTAAQPVYRAVHSAQKHACMQLNVRTLQRVAGRPQLVPER